MSIEADTQKDLGLDDQDAENVVGGKMNKKAQKKKAAHPTTSGAASMIVGTTLSSPLQTEYSGDPGADAATDDPTDC